MRPPKYCFREMQVGDFRYVTGVTKTNASGAWYRFRKRNQDVAQRQFIWTDANGGIKIERVG